MENYAYWRCYVIFKWNSGYQIRQHYNLLSWAWVHFLPVHSTNASKPHNVCMTAGVEISLSILDCTFVCGTGDKYNNSNSALVDSSESEEVTVVSQQSKLRSKWTKLPWSGEARLGLLLLSYNAVQDTKIRPKTEQFRQGTGWYNYMAYGIYRGVVRES